MHATWNLHGCACLSLVGGSLQEVHQGFPHIAQPLSEYLTGEGTSRKSEWVSLAEDALKAFRVLKQACMTAPILAFVDYTEPFLLESDASKDGLGAVLSQKQADGWYHPIAYDSRALTPHEKNYHTTKLEFLVLKWAVTQHFMEYLPYQSLLVRTDNNLLTYIMLTPNLDTMGHQWDGALVWFNFELKYQKGHDNTVADALSWVTTWLDPDMVGSILNRVTMGPVDWVEVHNPAIVEGNHHLQQNVCVATGHAPVQMHATDRAEAQKEDLMWSTVLNWLKAQKKTDLKALLAEHASSEEGRLILHNWHNFMIHQGACTCAQCPSVRPMIFYSSWSPEPIISPPWPDAIGIQVIRDVTIPCLCYRSVSGGQAWPITWQSIKSCTHCLQHEGDLSKTPLHPIVATALMDLLHVDFTSIEMTLQLNRLPNITNILFQDHFTKHIMVYVIPNQTAKTVTKFLYQGYISIFRATAMLLIDWGVNFMSSIIDEMCKLLRMKKLYTTPYYPQMNGLVERSHHIIMQMIGKLGEEKKVDWPGHLAEIVHAYNATQSAMIGYSPHDLMFGHRPRLPVSFYFPTLRGTEVPRRRASTKCVDKYVATIQDWFWATLQEAQIQSTAEAQRQKQYYNQTTGAIGLKPGNVIFVKADAFQRKKIKDRWEDKPH